MIHISKDHPSEEEMVALHERYKAGDESALEEMITGNLAFVIKVIAGYVDKNSPDWDDFFQEGTIGMMKAAPKWDPRKAAFSTYSAYWIRQRIKTHCLQSRRTIRLPREELEKINKLIGVIVSMQKEFGHRPSIDEIADELGMQPKRIQELLQAYANTISLDEPIVVDGEKNRTKHESVADSRGRSPRDLATLKDDCHQAVILLKELYRFITLKNKAGTDVRNKIIFFKRYGIFGHGPAVKVRQLGRQYHVTHQRVRMICLKIFSKRQRFRLTPYTEKSLKALLDSITTGIELMEAAGEKVPKDVLWIVKNR